MKKYFTIIGIAILCVACNQADRKQNKDENLSKMKHKSAVKDDLMMQAMDESMLAMHEAKVTGNIDFDFASMMLPHHKGAIVMAELVIKDGKNEKLVEFARKVIASQQKEIDVMEELLTKISQSPSKNADQFKRRLDQSMEPMMKGMSQTKTTGNLDKDFINLMIPHHQSAVDMAKAYLPYAKNQQLKKMSMDIIQSQEVEIKWLKSL